MKEALPYYSIKAGLTPQILAQALSCCRSASSMAAGNASGVFLAALGSAVIEMYERNPFTRAVGAILMFPLGFTAATYTTQMPILAVMSRQTEVTGLTYFAGLLSMTLGCCLIWLFLRCLPLRPGRG